MVMFVLQAVSVPAAAQETWKGFVGGLGGVTFGTVTSGAVAGQGGVRVAEGLYVIGEVGYMRNVLPKELRDELDDLVDELEYEFGGPITVDVSVPSLYGFGGLRWSPAAGALAPFVEGGVGVGNISLKVDKAEAFGIDFSDELEDELDSEDLNATKFLLALGGGLTARISNAVAADVGFRYTRIATEDPAINSSMVYGAVKIGF